jgi:dihydrofolate reductase
MGKIFSFHVVTADGYYEGPNQEFDWPVVDEEFYQFSIEQLSHAEMLMFGRATYDMMASYWPTPAAESSDPRVAELMNTLPKIVTSQTLDKAEWANTVVVRDLDELGTIKRQSAGDIIVMGSSNLTVNLIAAGLMDEVRIMVHPIVLGAGKSLFHTADRRIGLRLTDTRTFASGNVLLCYEPTEQ